MYALNLESGTGRVLSVCEVLPNGFYAEMPIVDSFPESGLHECRYINGEFVHDPLPEPEQPDPPPTQEERITALEAQLAAYEAAFAEGVSEGWA